MCTYSAAIAAKKLILHFQHAQFYIFIIAGLKEKWIQLFLLDHFKYLNLLKLSTLLKRTNNSRVPPPLYKVLILYIDMKPDPVYGWDK